VDGNRERFDEAGIVRRQAEGSATIEDSGTMHSSAMPPSMPTPMTIAAPSHAPVIVTVAAGVAHPTWVERLDGNGRAVAQVAGELVAQGRLEGPHRDEVRSEPQMPALATLIRTRRP
jgi:hypothetical protein